MNRETKLSKAQRELLGDLTAYRYHQGMVRGSGLASAKVLVRHGLIKRAGPKWYEVTAEGLALTSPSPATLDPGQPGPQPENGVV